MSFIELLDSIEWDNYLEIVKKANNQQVLSVLEKDKLNFGDFLVLLSESASNQIEALAQQAQFLTRRFFGKIIQLYVPLYISNECENQCVYCGFNSKKSGERISLTIEQAEAEARVLRNMGFRHILLVSGERKEVITIEYLSCLIRKMKNIFPSISLEIYPLKESEYQTLFFAGADGLTIYQETYDRAIYKKVHPAGPKSNFEFRLGAPERAGEAGYYKINIGALLGLGEWVFESIALGLHAQYLNKKFWQSQINISFPRLKSCLSPVSDRQLVQMICALRIFLPKAGLVLSTREETKFRDSLIPLGITQMSAASRTSPGAYSRITNSTQQFEVSDHRTAKETAKAIGAKGYEPVFKDWENVL